VGVDMSYSTKSAYSQKKKEERLIKPSSRKKILIATHCFFDSPHSYGNNLFPDFHDWFDFLGAVSEMSDYDWYFKTHPDFLPGNQEVLDHFRNKYPKFTQLPSDTSHHQIIEEGINFVLTTYGTIGFEYAALGKTVINASLVNPHIAYDFNIHPQSIEEYKNVLLNLDRIDHPINVNEVYEYYYMKNIYNTNNWLFNDYQKMEKDMGGYLMQFTPKVYDYFLNDFTDERHKKILKSLNNFVGSKDFRLSALHIN
jgi:hypothetical protein